MGIKAQEGITRRRLWLGPTGRLPNELHLEIGLHLSHNEPTIFSSSILVETPF
jgi:hypothetical protein